MGKNSNISDEDILKEETQPGVVVYRSNVPEGAGVFDMDIAPGIKEVTIKYDLLMLGCEKSFPDVEKLIIGEDVVSIEILNTLFPNVRWVLSMNYEFETGSYLVYNHFGFKTLLNVFCRGADETIDLGDIDSIDNFAFKGCESLNIIGGEDIKDWQAIEQDAFSESALKSQPFQNGIKKAGHIIVDIDYTADEIDIPDDRLKKIVFSSDIDFTKIKKLIIHRPETVEQINYQCGFPDTLVLNVGLDAFVCEIAREKIQDININLTTIPKGLGRAIIHPGSMQTPRCVNVHVHNKNETFDFVIPDCVSATTNGYSEIVTGFNLMASDPEYFKKFHHLKWLNTAFMYAANSRFKYVCAYKTYKRTKNELAKEYLIDYQKMAADAIALELAEKDFVDFLRLEFINLGYDEDIVKCLEEQNWNVALAYMLNEEKEKDSTGNTFVI